MLFYGRSTCDTGQMSRGPHNIVLGGMRVRVKRTDEEVERSMVFNHLFVGVSRDLAKMPGERA